MPFTSSSGLWFLAVGLMLHGAAAGQGFPEELTYLGDFVKDVDTADYDLDGELDVIVAIWGRTI